MGVDGGEETGGFAGCEEPEAHYAGGDELDCEGDAPDCGAGFDEEGYADWGRGLVGVCVEGGL